MAQCIRRAPRTASRKVGAAQTQTVGGKAVTGGAIVIVIVVLATPPEKAQAEAMRMHVTMKQMDSANRTRSAMLHGCLTK